jgi:hypothetical protein
MDVQEVPVTPQAPRGEISIRYSVFQSRVISTQHFHINDMQQNDLFPLRLTKA